MVSFEVKRFETFLKKFFFNFFKETFIMFPIFYVGSLTGSTLEMNW
jgi:hypothetical protein